VKAPVKTQAAPKKEEIKKPAPVAKKQVTTTPVKNSAVKAAPAKAEPVKKPEIAAPTKETAKTATKPLESKPAAPKEQLNLLKWLFRRQVQTRLLNTSQISPVPY
jgi:hypothetical protein